MTKNFDVEDMIATALCQDAAFSDDNHRLSGFTAPNWVGNSQQHRSLNSLLPSIKPKKAYAICNGVNDDRLVSTDYRFLLTHPHNLIGDGFEIMMFNDSYADWKHISPLMKIPKSLVSAGKCYFWSQLHWRKLFRDGTQAYYCTAIPFSRNGAPLAAYLGGKLICNPLSLGKISVNTLSIFEDCMRENATLCSVSEAVELIFPINDDAYHEVFKLRDGPMTDKGKRRALLHLVSNHLRKTSKKKTCEVKRHMRGVAKFNVGGYAVELYKKGLRDD